MKVFVVTWGDGLTSDDDSFSTNCGCSGLFTDRKKAEEKMLKVRDQFIDDLYEPYEETDEEEEESRDWVVNRTNHEVYGKPEEDYIEIDWATNWETETDREEIYIKLEEMEIV